MMRSQPNHFEAVDVIIFVVDDDDDDDDDDVVYVAMVVVSVLPVHVLFCTGQ